MGIRQLWISPEVLLGFLQAHNNMMRTYTVQNPLPDDVTLVDFQIGREGVLVLRLQSQKWLGDGTYPEDIILAPPSVTVHYLGDAIKVEVR